MLRRLAIALTLSALPLAAAAQTTAPAQGGPSAPAWGVASGQVTQPVAVPTYGTYVPAPERRAFVTFYGGFQTASDESSTSGTFSAYDETGTFSAAQSYDGGGMFWIGGGFKVAGNFAIGGAYSRVTDTQEDTVTVTAPHPIIFNRPRTATGSHGSLKHEENTFHLQGLYIVPVSDRFEVILGGGPSFTALTTDYITGAGFTEGSAPFTTITVSNIEVEEGDSMVVGFNFGAEAAFYVTEQVGLAGFLRFSFGNADIEMSDGTVHGVDIGGTQYGGGVRIRF